MARGYLDNWNPSLKKPLVGGAPQIPYNLPRLEQAPQAQPVGPLPMQPPIDMGRPSQLYRQPYTLTDRDLSDALVNRIYNESNGTTESFAPIIGVGLNRIGSEGRGPSSSLYDVFFSRGHDGKHQQFTASSTRSAPPEAAALIKDMIRQQASGTVPDPANGSTEYRFSGAKGWARRNDAQQIGGNWFAPADDTGGPFSSMAAGPRPDAPSSTRELTPPTGPVPDAGTPAPDAVSQGTLDMMNYNAQAPELQRPQMPTGGYPDMAGFMTGPQPNPHLGPGGVAAVGGGTPKAVIIHHTGIGGDVSAAGLQKSMAGDNKGVQHYIDREGVAHTIGGPGAKNISPGYPGTAGEGLRNANIVGIEVAAKSDADVTPAQIETAKKLVADLYPDVPVLSHYDVNPGDREQTEGRTITEAINEDRRTAPFREGITPYGDPGVTATVPPPPLPPPAMADASMPLPDRNPAPYGGVQQQDPAIPGMNFLPGTEVVDALPFPSSVPDFSGVYPPPIGDMPQPPAGTPMLGGGADVAAYFPYQPPAAPPQSPVPQAPVPPTQYPAPTQVPVENFSEIPKNQNFSSFPKGPPGTQPTETPGVYKPFSAPGIATGQGFEDPSMSMSSAGFPMPPMLGAPIPPGFGVTNGPSFTDPSPLSQGFGTMPQFGEAASSPNTMESPFKYADPFPSVTNPPNAGFNPAQAPTIGGMPSLTGADESAPPMSSEAIAAAYGYPGASGLPIGGISPMQYSGGTSNPMGLVNAMTTGSPGYTGLGTNPATLGMPGMSSPMLGMTGPGPQPGPTTDWSNRATGGVGGGPISQGASPTPSGGPATNAASESHALQLMQSQDTANKMNFDALVDHMIRGTHYIPSPVSGAAVMGLLPMPTQMQSSAFKPLPSLIRPPQLNYGMNVGFGPSFGSRF
jgi:N-acetylmuramoyl-L-alanine amidase